MLIDLIGIGNGWAQSDPRITDLAPISLELGVNRISQFSSDGRDATIVLAWQVDGGGRGHDVFMVTMPTKQKDAWRVVAIEGSGAPVVTDDPDRGWTMKSVRFAKGRMDGRDATLMLMAAREQDAGAQPSSVVYTVYRLASKGDRDAFEQVSSQRLAARFCNADMALSVASGLPVRGSYRGPRGLDGEFKGDGCPEGTNGEDASRSVISEQEKQRIFEDFLAWRMR